MIPTVEEIRDTAGMMDKILVTGKLNVNQRGQVLEPANTQTDPIPGQVIHPLSDTLSLFLHMVSIAWSHSEFLTLILFTLHIWVQTVLSLHTITCQQQLFTSRIFDFTP